MTPYLPPIERPPGLVMKVLYALARRQFGRVPTPFTVFMARMPLGFGTLYGKIGSLEKKLKLPPRLRMLVRERAASINGCAFCMDSDRWFALRESPEAVALLDALPEYKSSPLFTEAERAALDYATELIRDKHVQPDTFGRLVRQFSEREICEIAWLCAVAHVYNLTNIGLGIGSDQLCEVVALREPKRASVR